MEYELNVDSLQRLCFFLHQIQNGFIEFLLHENFHDSIHKLPNATPKIDVHLQLCLWFNVRKQNDCCSWLAFFFSTLIIAENSYFRLVFQHIYAKKTGMYEKCPKSQLQNYQFVLSIDDFCTIKTVFYVFFPVCLTTNKNRIVNERDFFMVSD